MKRPEELRQIFLKTTRAQNAKLLQVPLQKIRLETFLTKTQVVYITYGRLRIRFPLH